MAKTALAMISTSVMRDLGRGAICGSVGRRQQGARGGLRTGGGSSSAASQTQRWAHAAAATAAAPMAAEATCSVLVRLLLQGRARAGQACDPEGQSGERPRRQRSKQRGRPWR